MVFSPNDPFHSAKSRLLRAQTHISNLNTEIYLFRNEHPPALVREPDSDGTAQLFKFKFREPFPVSWSHSAIEALEALRSVLDQAAYAATVASGKVAPKRTQFPIADSPDDLENLIVGRKVCKDVPGEIVAVFRSFKPYKGGNDAIWTLNKLRNSNHTHLIPVGIQWASVRITQSHLSDEITPIDPIFDSTKNEIIFARGPIDGHFAFGAQPTFFVSFDDIQVTGRKHAIVVLRTAASAVENIMEETETECRRLGFIP
jgi:hypothetical protein